MSFIQRFGWKDNEGKKAPWLDVRVRQAMSMAIDRDTYIDAFSNVSNFNKEGLDAKPLYHTSMGYIPGVTLDPTSKDFGESAKYYKRDIAEAKKLLAAAGLPNGFTYTNHWPNFPGFGPNFPKQMAVIEQFNSRARYQGYVGPNRLQPEVPARLRDQARPARRRRGDARRRQLA